MTKKQSPKPLPMVGTCVKCKKDVTQDDYCSGCKQYVCEECNVGGLGVPWGGHAVEDHFKHYDDDGRELDDVDEDDE
jgi:hypothetical protein